MPDLGQEEQTCLPTCTTNLMIWFGKHGYPKLIVPGDDNTDDYIHTVHRVITATGARYDYGTRIDGIVYGIGKYIRDAGYDCDVEYRGIDWNKAQFPHIIKDEDADKFGPMKTPQPFTSDWLQTNDDPNKGFILLLAYVNVSGGGNVFSNAINAGHAVTLVNSMPNTILIHDPAHYDSGPGRKILTPTVLTGGSYRLPGYDAPTTGLLLLSGSQLEAPPGSTVLLTGAVCVTMHPASTVTQNPVATNAPGGPVIGAGKDAAPAPAPAAPSSTESSKSGGSASWLMWIFDLFFKK